MRFSSQANNYDTYSHIQAVIFDELLKLIQHSQRNASRILDLGCGTGANTIKLQKLFPHATLMAIDSSSPMISYAKKNHPGKNIHYQQHQLPDLPSTNPFDTIVSNACLHWLSPKNFQTLIAKIQGLLNSNGQFFFSVFGPKTYQELQQLLPHQPLVSAKFLNADSLQIILKNHFKKISLFEHTHSVVYPSLKVLLHAIKFTGTSSANAGLWTPRKLKTLEKNYLAEYGQIKASFEFIFASAS